MTTQFHRFTAIAAGAAALLLQGCSSYVSRGITDDGKATEVIFPNIDNDAWLKEGTFPNLDNLRAVAPGVTKDQLYDLLGRPHFSEGMAGPREWDYIFHFRKAGGGVTTCQYKAIFDKDYKAQTFHWLPAGCGDVLAVRALPTAERPAAASPVAPRRTTLGADGLFRFDGSSLADLMPEGRRKLDVLAADIKATDAVKVIGHTDRLGSQAYNNALSLARANTVRSYLAQAGVPAQRIQVEGRGESEPKVQCAQARRADLIACLAPNRRVEIEVSGER
ncbi:outer membrane protein OmpA-like peptidoglycan-associated protein [Variovorax paradoxus]|uniref:Outer membrane protein OmpA-like peptidoglycan-associated protein n=1 Tax=Variovorax paradoxus TaxID=34073 RepID=A0AAE4BYU0_VARPD|nr:OmpA family protein [Variovorax paradoxus]MDR6427459.1 outer membrane protein OmpA-like peptidoglycan-associated protein [Variovorax paradoxus]MDR6454621.1 outer membrane protein OmpA-like peptidoglycan-associated protein [Variovorax paradoxus]